MQKRREKEEQNQEKQNTAKQNTEEQNRKKQNTAKQNTAKQNPAKRVSLETGLLRKTVRPLIGWYEQNARVLPWREHPSPYRVWVSEIMLQQTRVEAVKPFYERFMTNLPDIRSLAKCQEERLLKLWEGLGYYNRVRNMQKAAQLVVREYAGSLPGTYEELLRLPGIGSYTAGAIASIAYGQAVPAVDGNVLRVVSRWTENQEDIGKQSVRKKIEEALTAVMPEDCPGTYNQALMELGATVCVPNGAPECGRCPVRELCAAHLHGRQTEFPIRSAQKARKIEERTVFVIRDGSHAALRRRPARGLLAGLYELPNLEGVLSPDEALAYVKEQGFSPLRIRALAPAKHIFSHVEWRMTGYFVFVEDGEKAGPAPGGTEPDGRERRASPDGGKSGSLLLIEPERIGREFPVPSAFSAYMKYLGGK